MKIGKIFQILTIVLSSLFCSGLNAALISEDLVSGSGDGFLTVDTINNLEFLDLTLSHGFSAQEILDGAGSFLVNGFRYATRIEVANLFSESGSYINAGGYYSENYTPANLLLDMLGTLCCGSSDFESSVGIFQESGVFEFSSFSVNHSDNTGQMQPYLGFLTPNESSMYWGHFLVRDSSVTVSEPMGILLLSTGLLFLVGIRRETNGIRRISFSLLRRYKLPVVPGV